ncbi:hypothetical protein B5X24_HaOG202595 [Helicoverpa armigera]|uniref:AP-3 complex subunit beta C-terminal domain-containing protein n=1 Tax=Helicoverpa armigera TaxID=29058 RepID=A0A2W1BA43_HELAM|nr:hypothetical protein B5X24_HaOG202595 [Helicoverpa armigera]
MSGTTSYNNDKVVMGEVEYPANDPASGAFFQPDYKKNEDLKLMLDGSKDSLKLEAMKRIIGMIAKGRDASDLFPAVVKNVVSKNIEVKKLVYVYLVRYAEEQQDLALLSISTFQRALKDPNQLIRASALRVLSSIRVPMIVPIVMLAIRDSASDMSPYVRKTAAHAIPKLYSLDPEQKEELVSIIDKLLSDKAPLVVGSAAMAFSEDELVKLQLLSLAVKLSVTQPDTLPVCRYVVSLARYDVSYDVRDRARMLRRFIEPQPGKQLHKYVADIFLPEKPKPDIQSSFKDRGTFTVGSLSQYIGTAAGGYRPLPGGPRSTLAAHLRDTAPAQHIMAEDTHDAQKNKSFYSEPESSGSGSASSSSEDSSSEASSDEEESATEDKKTEKPVKETNNYRSSNSGTSDSESDSESESGSDSESEQSADSSEEEPSKKNEVTRDKKQNAQQPKETEKEQKRNEKSNLELLLELDEVASSLPTMTPTCGGFLSPQSVVPTQGIGDADSITPVGPSHINTTPTEVLGRVRWGGTVLALRWSRAPHLYSHTMCAIDLIFTNHSANEVTNIRLHKKTLTGSRNIHEFAPIPLLSPSATATVTLGVDFADTIQPIEFTIISSIGEVPVSITPPVGELMRAVTMSQSRWDAEHKKLRGMTECDKKAVKVEDEQTICKRVFETANVAAITSTGDFLRFAGRMMSSQDLVLLSVRCEADSSRVTANCQNMAIASLLANQVAQALART